MSAFAWYFLCMIVILGLIVLNYWAYARLHRYKYNKAKLEEALLGDGDSKKI